LQIPGIGSFSGEPIICFIRHQEFGRVGVAKQNRTGGFEARDESGIGGGNVILAKKGTGGARPTSNIDAGFHGKRNSGEGRQGFAAGKSRFPVASPSQCGFRVGMNESVETELELSRPFEMSGDDF
jgi:hypothetical protein